MNNRQKHKNQIDYTKLSLDELLELDRSSGENLFKGVKIIKRVKEKKKTKGIFSSVKNLYEKATYNFARTIQAQKSFVKRAAFTMLSLGMLYACSKKVIQADNNPFVKVVAGSKTTAYIGDVPEKGKNARRTITKNAKGSYDIRVYVTNIDFKDIPKHVFLRIDGCERNKKGEAQMHKADLVENCGKNVKYAYFTFKDVDFGSSKKYQIMSAAKNDDNKYRITAFQRYNLRI